MSKFELWKPGQSGNPAGKAKGTVGGRQRAVMLLDKILAEEDVQAAIRTGLREYFLKKPVQAFRRIVLPLLPRQMKLDFDGPAVIVWKSLLEVHADAIKRSPPGEGPLSGIPADPPCPSSGNG